MFSRAPFTTESGLCCCQTRRHRNGDVFLRLLARMTFQLRLVYLVEAALTAAGTVGHRDRGGAGQCITRRLTLKAPLEQLAYIIEKAREFDAETPAVDADSGSNSTDDNDE
jgi:hypothetical protein